MTRSADERVSHRPPQHDTKIPTGEGWFRARLLSPLSPTCARAGTHMVGRCPLSGQRSGSHGTIGTCVCVYAFATVATATVATATVASLAEVEGTRQTEARPPTHPHPVGQGGYGGQACAAASYASRLVVVIVHPYFLPSLLLSRLVVVIVPVQRDIRRRHEELSASADGRPAVCRLASAPSASLDLLG